ncbi:MAG: hypothetical protein LBC68_13865 [Prevotellaceae bacterium]|nr:hypothetical protein [Prevotellaceae bacterium]
MITIKFLNKEDLLSDSTINNIYNLLLVEEKIIREELKTIMDVIRDDIICFMEYPYVERIYRDSYYSFFSKKHNLCCKDSLRISFFDQSINETNYFTTEDLEKYFFGYISLRPTTYRIIGSSFLHPEIMKNHNFVCCLCRKTVLVNGLKLTIHGFPYCAQDNESITCSEVSILNIMEYFGHKYPEYSTILPSQITKMLSKQTYERQLPSVGISLPNISYVLKKLGFGVKVYSNESKKDNTPVDPITYEDDEFRESLFIYIESGIPVILLSENHAILAIGRKEVSENQYKTNSLFNFSLKKAKTEKSFTDFLNHLLVMNDNNPPYELIDYNNQNSNGFKINSFIVPLYAKVNMTAYGLKESFTAALKILSTHEEIKDIQFIDSNRNYIYRYFFTSSKSYKNYIAKSQDLSYEFKILALAKTMPKFIGIVEIINETNFNEVDGVVVLDATESGNYNYLLFAANSNYLIIKSIQKYQIFAINEKFRMYKNNLKGEHTQWKG